MMKALFILPILCITLLSCAERDSFASKILNVKNNTKGKVINHFSNGTIYEVYDSVDEDFLGGRFEFTFDGNLKQYSFLCDNTRASYIEHYLDDKIQKVEGSPIVYSLSSADKAKDSMYVKRFISTMSYKNVKVGYSINNREFVSVDLVDEAALNYVKSFEKFVNVSEMNRFLFVTRFSGVRNGSDTTIIFYDTLDITRRKKVY